MSEFQYPDQQPTPDIKEIAIGEWFLPFENYSATPYSHSQPNYSSKIFNFEISPLGGLEAIADWSSRELEETIDRTAPVWVFGPSISEKITKGQIQQLEEKYETRLLNLSILVMDEKFAGQALPYAVECRLSDGVSLIADLNPIVEDGSPMTYNWKINKSDDVFEFLSPEIGTFLERVQMRVVPKELA